MPFAVDQTEHVGVATIQRQSSYIIRFKPRYQPREFMIFTCAREIFLSPSKEIRYDYRPMWGIEYQSACPLFAVAISESGRRETAVIDFNNGDRGKARVRCNGEVVDTVGSYLCQVRAGLYVGLRFESKVIAEADEGCEPPIEQRFNEWEIRSQPGHCSYLFASDPSNVFRLTVRGYESILESEVLK